MIKFSHCSACGCCFRCAKPHVVMFDDDRSGFGVLCIDCWDRLDQLERIRFYFAHWLEHAKWWERALAFIEWPVASWERMKLAVEADQAQEFQGYCQACGEFRKVQRISGLPRCPVCEHQLQERRNLGSH